MERLYFNNYWRSLFRRVGIDGWRRVYWTGADVVRNNREERPAR